MSKSHPIFEQLSKKKKKNEQSQWTCEIVTKKSLYYLDPENKRSDLQKNGQKLHRFLKGMNLLQIQEVQQTQNKKNPKKSKPRHITIKLLKTKVKKGIMKTTREKHHIV